MLNDLAENIAEVIYLSEMERLASDGDIHEDWDALADSVKEVYLRIAEEILDIIDENDDDLDPLYFGDDDWID